MKSPVGILAMLRPKKGMEDDSEGPSEDSADQEDDSLPGGLVEAVGEFRAAKTDYEAARALMNAVRLCSE